MKIVNADRDGIYFDNGNRITYNHRQECCEHNYADFEQIDDLALQAEFDENLIFEEVPRSGFIFGNEGNTFFVPCYSEQNGYYSSDIKIYYNDIEVLNVECREVS